MARNRRKVLLISHASGWHGAEKGLTFLAKVLSERFDVKVLLPKKGVLLKKLEELAGVGNDEHADRKIQTEVFPYLWWVVPRGVFASDIDFPLKKNPLFFIFASFLTNLLATIWIAKNFSDFSLFWTNSSVVPVGGFSSRVAKIPHIWHIREIPYANPEFLYLFPVPKVIPKLSEKVVVVAPRLSEWYPNSTFIPNPIPFDFDADDVLRKLEVKIEKVSERRQRTVLMVGFMSPVKRVELALRALAGLENVKLRVIGGWDEKYRKRIESLALKLRVEVEFLGFFQRPWEAVQDADVFLMTSYTEVCPFSLLEALGAGSVCVITRSVAISSWLHDAVLVSDETPDDIRQKLSLAFEGKIYLETYREKLEELSFHSFRKKVLRLTESFV